MRVKLATSIIAWFCHQPNVSAFPCHWGRRFCGAASTLCEPQLSHSSLRSDAQHRTPMCNCALWNLGVPGLVLRNIPERRLRRHSSVANSPAISRPRSRRGCRPRYARQACGHWHRTPRPSRVRIPIAPVKLPWEPPPALAWGSSAPMPRAFSCSTHSGRDRSGMRCKVKCAPAQPMRAPPWACAEGGLTPSMLDASLEKIKALHEVSPPKERPECPTNDPPLTSFTS
jgi:hypothetical protein